MAHVSEGAQLFGHAGQIGREQHVRVFLMRSVQNRSARTALAIWSLKSHTYGHVLCLELLGVGRW